VSKGTNRNMYARSTLVQVLAAYTNPESHNAQRHRRTDGQTDRQTDRQTDGQQAAANSRSYCVAVRSAKKLGSPWTGPRSLSPNFKGLLFGWTFWIYLPNLKFVALPVSEIIGSTPQIWAVPGYAHAPFSPFLPNFKGLLLGWILWIYLPNLKFVALRVPQIIGGTQKNWAVPGYAHAPFSPKFFMGLCSDGPCEYICQIWSP